MEVILLLIVAAFLVEAIWETLKMVWQEGKLSIDRVGALTIGIIVALVTKIDILIAVGLETSYPIVGILATGILISRGGNFIHDLVEKLDSAD